MSSPPRWEVPKRSSSRPRIVRSTASGCSSISLRMKDSWSPASYAAGSMSSFLAARSVSVALQVLAVRRVAAGGQGGHLAVAEVHDRGRVADQRGQVGGDVHLLVADADDQRAPVAGHDDPVREVGVQDREPVGALDPAERLADPTLEGVGVRAGDQVGDHLGVGVRRQVDARLGELRAQRRGVVDDPVVHDGDVTLGVDVRVRVDVVGRAVGRPPGVADADLAAEPLGQLGLQVPDPPGLLHDLEALAGAEHGEARRVVAAVLEPAEPLQQQRRCLLAADVPDDPAHVFLLLIRRRSGAAGAR